MYLSKLTESVMHGVRGHGALTSLTTFGLILNLNTCNNTSSALANVT